MWLLASRDHMPVRMIDDLLSCPLTGGHPCRVCASGEETQNGRSGPQRAGHYHRHRSEGERHIYVSVGGKMKRWQENWLLAIKMPFCGFSILTSKLVRQVVLLKPAGQNVVARKYILGAFKMREVDKYYWLKVQVAVYCINLSANVVCKKKKILWWVAFERGTAKEEAV